MMIQDARFENKPYFSIEDILEEIFGEMVIAANFRAVRAQAAAMPPAERFNFLLRSILPTPDNF